MGIGAGVLMRVVHAATLASPSGPCLTNLGNHN
jgi:hypothetical protein